jgi:hypothetical protein
LQGSLMELRVQMGRIASSKGCRRKSSVSPVRRGSIVRAGVLLGTARRGSTVRVVTARLRPTTSQLTQSINILVRNAHSATIVPKGLPCPSHAIQGSSRMPQVRRRRVTVLCVRRGTTVSPAIHSHTSARRGTTARRRAASLRPVLTTPTTPHDVRLAARLVRSARLETSATRRGSGGQMSTRASRGSTARRAQRSSSPAQTARGHPMAARQLVSPAQSATSAKPGLS